MSEVAYSAAITAFDIAVGEVRRAECEERKLLHRIEVLEQKVAELVRSRGDTTKDATQDKI